MTPRTQSLVCHLAPPCHVLVTWQSDHGAGRTFTVFVRQSVSKAVMAQSAAATLGGPFV